MKKALGKINFKGTLLEASYPPGFDEEGRRLLAECPEFKLWEMYQPGGEQILERSPVIERAYHKARLRISGASDGASDPIERIAWATALSRLVEIARKSPPEPMPLEVFLSTDHNFHWPGNSATASKLAATIGKEILGVLNSADRADQKAEVCVGKFKNALNALIRDRACTAVRFTEYLLIIHAEGYFRSTMARPTKSDLIERLGFLGISYKGANAKAKWREKFANVGLGELPD